MVSSILGSSSGSWFSAPNWSSDLTSAQDLSDLYANSISDLTSSFSTAASNQLSGQVNLAADAAAKRLGVTLPPSSGSTTSSSSTAPTATSTSSTKKPSTPSGGPTSAFTNIDKFLASLDGNAAAPASTSSTATPFSLNTFLNSLDQITSAQNLSPATTPAAPVNPSGKNFSVASYLATLDSITARPAPVVNVTT